MLPAATRRWFPYIRPPPTSSLRLFCLPYAGGAASVFIPWGPALARYQIEVLPVQPAGRETRLNEPAFTRSGDYVAALAEAIQPLLDRPYALFGHSMGALMAFELTRALRAAAQPLPTYLFVSAFRAPHLPPHNRDTHLLPDPELSDHLRKLDGTPEEVLANRELRELVFPTIRRDFELLNTYEHRAEPPLDVPVRVFGGLGDQHVQRTALEAWREHTLRFLGVRMFPGGHLFLTQSRTMLLEAILQDVVPSSRPG